MCSGNNDALAANEKSIEGKITLCGISKISGDEFRLFSASDGDRLKALLGEFLNGCLKAESATLKTGRNTLHQGIAGGYVLLHHGRICIGKAPIGLGEVVGGGMEVGDRKVGRVATQLD